MILNDYRVAEANEAGGERIREKTAWEKGKWISIIGLGITFVFGYVENQR